MSIYNKPFNERKYWQFITECKFCGVKQSYRSLMKDNSTWYDFANVVRAMDDWKYCENCGKYTKQPVIAMDDYHDEV